MSRDRKIIENYGVPEYATFLDLPTPSLRGPSLVFVRDSETYYKISGNNWTESLIPSQIDSSGYIVAQNLVVKQFVSEYASSVIAGTGTPTLTKSDVTESVTITFDPSTTGRAFVTLDSVSYLAGHTYCISFEIGSNLIIPTTAAENFINCTTAPTLDFGTLVITNASLTASSKQAIIFQPTTTQSLVFRIGFGNNGNVTSGAGGATVEISKLMIVDLSVSGINIPPPYVQANQSASISSQYAGSLTTSTAGKLTVTSNIQSSDTPLSIAIWGDSYVNDNDDYPSQLSQLKNPRIGTWYQRATTVGVSVAGTRPVVYLATFEDKMQKLIDQGTAPKYVLLQSSINTVNIAAVVDQDAARTADLAIIRSAAVWAKARNIQPIFTNLAAWKAGTAGWVTNGYYLAQQKWDTAIYALGAELNIPVFDIRSCVEDPNIPYAMAAWYASGDNIHPNPIGFKAIASKLQGFLSTATPAPDISKVITAAGTTGAQTINALSGAVNFAAAAASLVVTNNLVNVYSVVICQVSTNDTTMKSVAAVPAAGSFTIYPNANPTAETRVLFTVIN